MPSTWTWSTLVPQAHTKNGASLKDGGADRFPLREQVLLALAENRPYLEIGRLDERKRATKAFEVSEQI